jgi:hypothetical protein
MAGQGAHRDSNVGVPHSQGETSGDARCKAPPVSQMFGEGWFTPYPIPRSATYIRHTTDLEWRAHCLRAAAVGTLQHNANRGHLHTLAAWREQGSDGSVACFSCDPAELKLRIPKVQLPRLATRWVSARNCPALLQLLLNLPARFHHSPTVDLVLPSHGSAAPLFFGYLLFRPQTKPPFPLFFSS